MVVDVGEMEIERPKKTETLRRVVTGLELCSSPVKSKSLSTGAKNVVVVEEIGQSH